MYKLCFFVPDTHLESVKRAVLATGAGKLGNYDQCCWQTPGHGQFRAIEGSQPFIGQKNRLETVNEYKVELLCGSECLQEAIAALRSAHPYEEPAFEYWAVNIT